MEIRELTKNDIDSCVEIFMSSYNTKPWNYKWNAEKAHAYLTEYQEAKRFVGFVAIDNGEIVSALLAHLKTWWTKDQLYIDEVFVSDVSKGKGVGKKIIQHCEDFCKQNDIEIISLMTNEVMPAYTFHSKNDFVKVNQYVFMFKQL
jgi:GNAT superfamily N-acetyltransferase